jgi:hypothetical protein
LSISVELVSVENNSHLWGEEYNRNLAGLLTVQGDITKDVSDKLRRKLTGGDEKRLAKRSTTNPEAYRLYLQGRYFVEKFTKGGVEKGIECFHQAIDLDPNYALAYDGLSSAYAVANDLVVIASGSNAQGERGGKEGFGIRRYPPRSSHRDGHSSSLV